ncbi:Methyltransferase domain-containing protein [Butyrivibrio sp. ob235]|uniref:SAM-dependent methyltransferase n=1 Tax=Butyrivibrio sp. ob235 TaxID=1761780 RepID=UPI0008AFE846|nr:methyltransferase domain-containing protein [Butyrivibrio sp. ob235]SEM26363.1 Methyltransferase domain-containing protein [Butyrivibrio sp. ob235]
MGIGANIRNYINNNTSGILDADIKEEKELVYFYHLSEMRKSLYNWYEFKEGSKLLEIGAGFGALTGLFCERCGHVTAIAENEFRAEAIRERYKDRDNLEVMSFSLPGVTINSDKDFYRAVSEDESRIDDFLGSFDDNDRYDYIILTGVLEQLSSGHGRFLEGLVRLLAAKGKMLIATENRYGLKYLCGEKEDVSGVPFLGVQGGSGDVGVGVQGHPFSRSELLELLDRVGLTGHKLFYPLPDYRFPLQVYTDDYLPQKNIGERVLFYHDDNRSLIADEKKLYSDIIDNGVFPFVANSFLAECMKGDREFGSVDSSGDVLSPISFVALTTDRGPEAALTTVIKGDMVEKRPLYSEGGKSIQEVYRNVCEMKDRGLPVIEHELKGDVISMPYITAPALMDYMRTISDDRDKIAGIFEQLWTMILQSSDEVPESQNKILEYVENKGLNWGPILKKVYMEMMPMNCFYIDGKIYFFDQEFSRENFPAKYAMFRTILYTYINIPEIENVLPIAEVKNKYGFEEALWQIFMAEENRFVSFIRRLSDNRFFYDRLGVDEARMLDNAKRLLI